MIFDWSGSPSYSEFGNATTYTLVYVSGEGGAVYTLTLNGSLTPTGLILKRPQQTRARVFTVLSADLQREVAKAIAGNLSSTANLTRQTQKTTSGTLSATGSTAFLKMFARVVARTLEFASQITKASTRHLSRQLAISGSAQKHVALPKSGRLGASGSVLRTTQKLIARVLSPIGSFIRGVQTLTLERVFRMSGRRTKAVFVQRTRVLSLAGAIETFYRVIQLIPLWAANNFIQPALADNGFVQLLVSMNAFVRTLPIVHQIMTALSALNDFVQSRLASADSIITIKASRNMQIQNFDLIYDTASKLRFRLDVPEPVATWHTEFKITQHANTVLTKTNEIVITDADHGVFDVFLSRPEILAIPVGTYKFTFRRTDLNLETMLTAGTITVRQL